MGGIQEVLVKDNIHNILNAQKRQIIRSGITPNKKACKVTKTTRQYQGDDKYLHLDITVTDILDYKKTKRYPLYVV